MTLSLLFSRPFSISNTVLLISQVLGDTEHPLLAIVRECLSNVADRRPTAEDILQRVSQLQAEAEDDMMERDKLQMIVELQRLTTECEELQVTPCGLSSCSPWDLVLHQVCVCVCVCRGFCMRRTSWVSCWLRRSDRLGDRRMIFGGSTRPSPAQRESCTLFSQPSHTGRERKLLVGCL